MYAEQLKLIDTAIGLIFVFLIVAIFVTALVELLSNMLRLRSVNLVQGMAWMLGDGPSQAGDQQSGGLRSWLAGLLIGHQGVAQPIAPVVGNEAAAVAPDSVTGQVLKHDLVSRLAAGQRVAAYIDGKLFATALVTVLTNADQTKKTINDGFADLAGLVQNSQNTVIRDALTPIIVQAQASAASAEEKVTAGLNAIEQWYDRSMNQASDWYKARIQRITIGFALLVAIGGNIDAIRIAERLWSDNALRQVVVAQAMAAAENPALAGENCKDADAPTAIKCNQEVLEKTLGSLKGLPVGWAPHDFTGQESQHSIHLTVQNADGKRDYWAAFLGMLKHIPGWLLTAAAASMGAPFWFGLLQKVTPLRGKAAGGQTATAAAK